MPSPCPSMGHLSIHAPNMAEIPWPRGCGQAGLDRVVDSGLTEPDLRLTGSGVMKASFIKVPGLEPYLVQQAVTRLLGWPTWL